jgi:7,8-dihydropterin-6-yl-methyl-4-(beta-D-ribofuranosyl)aminobenzene 5'-phosphate synthase
MVKITEIVDDEAGEGLSAEHGFSLLIETDGGRRILFDTGQGPAFKNNVSALKVDLSAIDTVALSHGHYDHTGGLHHVLGASAGAAVYCHPSAFLPRYSIKAGKATPVGLPRESARALDKLPGGRLRWVNGPVTLTEAIGMTGPVPRKTLFEDVGGPFYMDTRGEIPDNLEDDASLWIDTPAGLVVLTGCCHSGIVNTINYIFELSGKTNIVAIIGGLHLVHANETRLAQTVDALKSYAPELIVPCHCTGSRAVEAFQGVFGERVLRGCSGLEFEF